MNAYVTFDGYKYIAVHGKWLPGITKPATYRMTLSGNADVTYGPSAKKVWEGVLGIDVSPASGFGSIANFRATIEKKAGLSFTDHYGNSYTVHTFGEFRDNSFSPMWDASSNVFHIQVRLVEE